MKDLVDRYLAVWNETGAPARRAAIEKVFTPGVRYIDPMAAVEGWAGLDGLIGRGAAAVPGAGLCSGWAGRRPP